MSMLKKLGFAAAVALIAIPAMATNFRAADQVYVPIAGHIGQFVTDLVISNVSTDPVTVSVIFSSGPNGTQTQFSNLFNLAAGERRFFADFVGTPVASGGLGLTSALGQIIFNGCKTNTSCGADTQDPNTGVSPNFRNISVESRIYSFPSGTTPASNPPTTGQLFSAYPWYNYVSEDQAANGLDKVFIVGVRNDQFYRTNIGFANASQFSNTTILLKLYNGSNPNPVDSKEIGLGPLGVSQTSITGIFSNTTTFNPNMYVTVEQKNSFAISSDTSVVPQSCQPNGCPGFFAWGSQLDNQTNDATTLEPQYLKALTDPQINCIYPAPDTAPCKGTPVLHRGVRH